MPLKRVRLLLPMLLLGACGHAVPDVASAELSVGGQSASVPSAVATVIPADDETRQRVPDVIGQTVAELEFSAHRAGVPVRVIAFDEAGTVTSQDPAPDEPLQVGGYLVVWLGTPPTPEPVLDAPIATAHTSTQPIVDATAATNAFSMTAGEAEKQPAPEPVQPPSPSAPSPAAADKSGEVNPETAYPNIRTLPPAEVGLQLAGRASWYGTELAGAPVACGGIFDPTGLTIATRELRCGTRVRVTGPAGTQVEATVTDWGPATWTQKRFDLSMAVFAQLAPLSRGWIDVDLEVIDAAS